MMGSKFEARQSCGLYVHFGSLRPVRACDASGQREGGQWHPRRVDRRQSPTTRREGP
jgi:hypothetical protein